MKDTNYLRIALKKRSLLPDAATSIFAHDQGIILPAFAICALLIILLSVMLTIQKPLDDANAVRLQQAVSVASADALYSIKDPQSDTDPASAAALAAADTAFSIMENTYQEDITGFFGQGISSFTAWMPIPGALANDYTDFMIYGCGREEDEPRCVPCSISATPANNTGFCAEPSNPHISENAANGWARQLAIVRGLFDTNGIDDFFNGMFIFAQSQTNNILEWDISSDNDNPIKTQEAVSASIMKTNLTYVLIDRTMSISEGLTDGQNNYRFVFGENNGNSAIASATEGKTQIEVPDRPTPANSTPTYDTTQWPPENGHTPAGTQSLTDWDYPDGAGLFNSLPATPNSSFGITNYNVYRFYASLCSNEVWTQYKSAAVDLIDWLAGSSAFSNTTFVGITGPGPLFIDRNLPTPNGLTATPLPPWGDEAAINIQNLEDDISFSDFLKQPPLIPVHPTIPLGINAAPNYLTVPYGHDTTMPAAGEGLSEAKTEAYRDLINTSDPGFGALWGADQDPTINENTGVADSLGHNLWDLALCRGLIDTNPNNDWLLTPDVTSPSCAGSNSTNCPFPFEHTPAAMRQRNAAPANTNWCDDDTSTSNIVDLEDSRSGNENGESTRNLIASLAPHVYNINNSLHDLENSADIAGWQRPGAVMTFGEDLTTGWRSLSEPLNAAANVLQQAEANYQNNPLLHQTRPLATVPKTIVVFAFGLWSEIALRHRMAFHGISLNDARLELQNEFRNVLARIACELETRVILAMLPYTDTDIESTIAANDVINEFLGQKTSQCSTNQDAPEQPEACVGMTPDIHMFIVDWRRQYFWNNDMGTPLNLEDDIPLANENVDPPFLTNEAHIKLNAARYYRNTMPLIVKRFLTEWVFGL